MEFTKTIAIIELHFTSEPNHLMTNNWQWLYYLLSELFQLQLRGPCYPEVFCSACARLLVFRFFSRVSVFTMQLPTVIERSSWGEPEAPFLSDGL